MQIKINGETESVSDDLSIAELLAARKMDPQRVAVERNKKLVPRARHGETSLQEGDELEIVTFVGGG